MVFQTNTQVNRNLIHQFFFFNVLQKKIKIGINKKNKKDRVLIVVITLILRGREVIFTLKWAIDFLFTLVHPYLSIM